MLSPRATCALPLDPRSRVSAAAALRAGLHIVARRHRLPCFRHIDYTYCISNSQARYRASHADSPHHSPVASRPVIGVWAGSSFTLARTGGLGGEKLLVPQIGAATVAIVTGATLWRLVHEGSFRVSEKILAAGAITALAAIAVQIIIGGGAVRQLRNSEAIRQAPARGWRFAQRIAAVLLAITAICMGAALCVTSILPHQIWRDLLEAADASSARSRSISACSSEIARDTPLRPRPPRHRERDGRPTRSARQARAP